VRRKHCQKRFAALSLPGKDIKMGKKLDRKVALLLTPNPVEGSKGWQLEIRDWSFVGLQPLPYSTDWNCAKELMELMQDTNIDISWSVLDQRYMVGIQDQNKWESHYFTSKELPVAICKAFLEYKTWKKQPRWMKPKNYARP
jgi:hypothetical protein